ncbi:MAG TPA: 5-methylcytosine-specific restriction endonuclease system specificity protein McrC [Negativicutes bacterium]|nr:5-methylcytosine-specific restriction endonuclease system specificity protein McrC [Negativicutes bacterium]
MVKTGNIYYMLAYAYQTLNEAEFKSVQSVTFDHVHDLFAAILSKGVANQIRRGLHKDYIGQTDVLAGLRGKIDISDSIKHQTMVMRRMVCHYDLFFEDTLLNQILKSTMLLLIRSEDVKPENRKALRKLLLFLENVSPVDPFHINWSACRYHASNAAYKMLIGICRLVIKGLLMTTDGGEYRLRQYLDDQRMHRLYEKFVLAYFRKKYPQLNPSASHIDWNIDGGDTTFLPLMKSDITLTYGSKTLIIDTKYYGNSMQRNPMFDSRSIISGNLYQIYTYVKNKDRAGSGNVSGLLLYAKTDDEISPDNDYLMGGNRISVKTLDLSADWAEIEKQLASVAALV